MLLDPGQLHIPKRILGQRDDIQRIRTLAHDLRQTSQLAVTGLGIHLAKRDGGQTARIRNRSGKCRNVANPRHGTLDKRKLDAHLPSQRTIQKTILLLGGGDPQFFYLRHESFYRLSGSSAKTFRERRRRGRLHTQRDNLVRGEMTIQGVNGFGLNFTVERATIFVRDLGGAK